MKNFKNGIFFIIILLILSCNEEEQSNELVNYEPSELEIFVENITVDSAELGWNEPISNHESEITYSIYLNDQILNSGMSETKYELLNLDSSTDYQIKIIAENAVGESSDSIQFTTLENLTLLLKKHLGNDGSEANFTYTDEKITQISFSVSNYGSNTYYNYDLDGNVLSQSSNDGSIYGNSATYVYDDRSFSEIRITDGYADAEQIHEIVYTNNSLYTRTEYFSDFETTHVGTFEVNLSKDSNGKIIQVNSKNTDNNKQSRLVFEYDKSLNLTKITDQDQNQYEIVYDNKRNFHTYASGYSNGWSTRISDVMSLLFLDNSLAGKLRLIPDLHNHINPNNPLRYSRNGDIIRSFEYEYNEYGYPVKLITDGMEINLLYY